MCSEDYKHWWRVKGGYASWTRLNDGEGARRRSSLHAWRRKPPKQRWKSINPNQLRSNPKVERHHTLSCGRADVNNFRWCEAHTGTAYLGFRCAQRKIKNQLRSKTLGSTNHCEVQLHFVLHSGFQASVFPKLYFPFSVVLYSDQKLYLTVIFFFKK